VVSLLLIDLLIEAQLIDRLIEANHLITVTGYLDDEQGIYI